MRGAGGRGRASLTAALAVALAAAAGAPACGDEPAPAAVTFADVAPVLAARCAGCHGVPGAGGFDVASPRGLLGCTADGRSVTAGAPGAPAPLVAALDRDDHRGAVSGVERAALVAWVEAGAPLTRGGVHAARFADPRAPDGHAAQLRRDRYAAMLDPNHADACGVCHDGAPSRPVPAPTPAPGATSCTTCHTEPAGALACGTCHGDGPRAFPPRDPCFGGRDAAADPHGRHAAATPSRAGGFACAVCHPTPAPGRFDGAHADGRVEVWLDERVAGAGARWDAATRTCTGTCHARGGARPVVGWGVGERVGCGDCHGAPPASHVGRLSGSCRACHAEADARGESLAVGPLHLNGRVDVGDGSGRCGACHGAGDDPWPRTGAHLAHAAPTGAAPVPCVTCHELPVAGAAHPSGRGQARVALAGLAVRGGSRARYDAASGSCAETYCHAGSGGTRTSPRWTDGSAGATCTACHGAPPPPPHAARGTCGEAGCHAGATTETGAIAPAWAALHVNGVVDRAAP